MIDKNYLSDYFFKDILISLLILVFAFVSFQFFEDHKRSEKGNSVSTNQIIQELRPGYSQLLSSYMTYLT